MSAAGKQLIDDFAHPTMALDSNRTQEHVPAELQAYSPLMRKGGCLVVFDTIIDEMPAGSFPDRPWDENDILRSAAQEFSG